MPKEIFMPKLSSTMQVGTLLRWFKEEGEPVEIGEPLFEIMTDKINIEVESYDSGILLKKYYEPEAEIPVNQVIGYIGNPGEKVPDQPPAPGSGLAESPRGQEGTSIEEQGAADHQPEDEIRKVRATPAARALARKAGVDLGKISGSGPRGRIQRKDVEQYLEAAGTKPKATPLAQKIAKEEQVDLRAISGTGSGGKIMKRDVLEAVRASEQQRTEKREEIRKPLSGLRKVVANRMAQSAFTAPHVTLSTEIDMAKAVEMRQSLLPVIEKQTGLRLTYTDILIKAAATALKRFPEVNVHFENDEVVSRDEVNVGMAVAVKDGLLVPVIKNADKKGLAAICAEAKDLSKRAREQKLLPDDLKGSTFTISNLGMYPIDVFTPIINLPEIAILGVGRIQEKPVVIGGEIVIRPMMTASLSFDHRVIDGAPAAEFLAEIKRILENPLEMIV